MFEFRGPEKIKEDVVIEAPLYGVRSTRKRTEYAVSVRKTDTEFLTKAPLASWLAD